MRWAGTNAVVGVICATCLGARAHGFSPIALAADPEARLVYVACATTNVVLALDAAELKTKQRIQVPGHPFGLTVSQDKLYVACGDPAGSVAVIDLGNVFLTGCATSGMAKVTSALAGDHGVSGSRVSDGHTMKRTQHLPSRFVCRRSGLQCVLEQAALLKKEIQRLEKAAEQALRRSA